MRPARAHHVAASVDVEDGGILGGITDSHPLAAHDRPCVGDALDSLDGCSRGDRGAQGHPSRKEPTGHSQGQAIVGDESGDRPPGRPQESVENTALQRLTRRSPILKAHALRLIGDRIDVKIQGCNTP